MVDNSIARRPLVSSALAAAVAAMSLGAIPGQADAAARTAKVGKSFTVQLSGTPGTGYIWQYNAGKSANGGIVSVTSLGYGTSTGEAVGGPSSYAFRITPLSAGQARLVFEYLRPWEGTPVKRQEQSVDVRP